MFLSVFRLSTPDSECFAGIFAALRSGVLRTRFRLKADTSPLVGYARFFVRVPSFVSVGYGAPRFLAFPCFAFFGYFQYPTFLINYLLRY